MQAQATPPRTPRVHTPRCPGGQTGAAFFHSFFSCDVLCPLLGFLFQTPGQDILQDAKTQRINVNTHLRAREDRYGSYI
jgi:hypothetical protein